MTTYKERLLDPRWQRRRLDILSRSDFACEVCESTNKTLHVHHKRYRKGAMPWEYADHELQALCVDCHEEITHVRARLDEALAELDAGDIEEIAGFADGLVAKRHVFSDRTEGLKPRSWRLLSWSHARGFVVCLTAGIRPEAVYRIIDMQPITCETVERLGFDDLLPQIIAELKETDRR